MDSVQAISSISAIYDRFLVTRNLRRHMFRVGVAEMVCDNWKGTAPNKDDVVAACLLHDIGNIVKFDFSKENTIKMLGEDGKSIASWQKVKDDIIARYGRFDTKVNHNMVAELGVDDRILFLVDHMGGIFENKRRGDDCELMVCGYADFRVEPTGIFSVTDRFMDFARRCKDSKSPEMRARGLFVIKELPMALEIERQIFADVSITPEGINDKSIKPYLDKYNK